MPIKKNKDWLLPEGIPEILPVTGIPVGQAMVHIQNRSELHLFLDPKIRK